MSPQQNYKEATTLKSKYEYTHNFLGDTELFKTDCSITLGEEDRVRITCRIRPPQLFRNFDV
jgi:hypothetical protein